MRIGIFTLFILFLTGCSLPYLNRDVEILSYEEYKDALPTKITNKFKLNGKLSLFINKKGQTGKVLWDFKNDKDFIHILTPFNTKIAEITLLESEKKVTLKFSNNNNQDSEELISKIFGNKESIFLLKEFITSPPQQLLNMDNIQIKYGNWNIFYKGKMVVGGRLLPKIIEFEKNNIGLKIFVSDWIL